MKLFYKPNRFLLGLFFVFLCSSLGYCLDLKNGLAVISSHQTASSIGEEDNLYDNLISCFSDNYILVDSLTTSDVLDGALDYYRAVFLLGDSSLSQAEIDAYHDYIKNGGYLIATYDTSLRNEAGELGLDFALGELLGISLAAFTPSNMLTIGFQPDFSGELADELFISNEAYMVKAQNGASILAKFYQNGNCLDEVAAVVATDSTLYFAENLFKNKPSEAISLALIDYLAGILGENSLGGYITLDVSEIKPVVDEVKVWYKTIEREFKNAERSFEDILPEAKEAALNAAEVYKAINFAVEKNLGHKIGPYLKLLKDLTDQMLPSILTTRNAETRAVWIDYQSFEAAKTEADFRGIVQKLAQANINIILPETIYNGTTLYRSKISYQNPKYQELGFDPLEVVIDEAHKLGIEVHPWVWVFCGGFWHQFGPVLENHPDWVELDENGCAFSNWEYGTAWINASHPDARQYLLELFKELIVNYPIDGLHIDYIRYNEDGIGHFGYSEFSKATFYQKTGLNLEEISFGSSDWRKFNTWRENNVTSFVKEVRDLLKTLKPEALLSAAVVPDPQHSRQNVMQDWKLWIDKGYLDFLMTMDYRNDTAGFKANAQKGLDVVADKTWVYPGLGLYVNDRFNNMGQIKATRSVGSTGVALFSNISFWKEKYTDAKDGLFRNASVMPMRQPFTAAAVLLNEGADKLTRAGLNDMAADITKAAKAVLTWEENLENAVKLQDLVTQTLTKLKQLKNERLLKTLEHEVLASSFIAVQRIANIFIFQNTLREAALAE